MSEQRYVLMEFRDGWYMIEVGRMHLFYTITDECIKNRTTRPFAKEFMDNWVDPEMLTFEKPEMIPVL